VAAAVALCVLAGALLELLDEELPQRPQEGLETVVSVAAIAVVTFMAVWMRRRAHQLSGVLRARAGDAPDAGVGVGAGRHGVLRRRPRGPRDGRVPAGRADDPVAASLGALLGLSCAVAVGVRLYRGGIRPEAVLPGGWGRVGAGRRGAGGERGRGRC